MTTAAVGEKGWSGGDAALRLRGNGKGVGVGANGEEGCCRGKS